VALSFGKLGYKAINLLKGEEPSSPPKSPKNYPLLRR